MLFSDKLMDAIDKKENPSVVGLDPRINLIPDEIKEDKPTDTILEFNKRIIDAIYDIVPAVKPQVAFYEVFGPEGINAFLETCKYAKKKGLIVIIDIKRNDIGSTAEAYAKAWDKDYIDAMTINPYLGSDGIIPFIELADKEKGIFILVKTSNPSSKELQDLETKDGKKVYEVVGELVNELGKPFTGERGYSAVGAVIGATHPESAKRLRKIMPNSYFLVPGYGAQGGKGKDLIWFFNNDGYGSIINSSRGIIFAYKKSGGEFDTAAREAAINMKTDIQTALKEAGKWPW